MAPIARRAWSDLRDELMTRVGRKGLGSFEDRAGRFLEAAQYELATLFHFYELDEEDDAGVLSTTSNQLAVPAECYAIFSFSIRHPGTGQWIRNLVWEEAHSILNRYKQSKASDSSKLDRYTRYGSNIELPLLPDQAYKTTLRYYRIPVAPDYTTGSPDLPRQWDEILLDYAEVIAWRNALWRPDLATAAQQRLDYWYQNVPQPYLKDIPLFGAPEQKTRAIPHGGAVG